MPTPYPGNIAYTANISIPIDSDPPDAAALAVPLQQLADRTAYLNDVITGGAGATFNDVTLTGTTTISDDVVSGSLTSVTLAASDAVSIASVTDALFLGGNTIELGSTTTILVGATTDVNITAGDDITLTAADDITIAATGDVNFTGLGTKSVNGPFVTQGTYTANGIINANAAVTINDLLTVDDVSVGNTFGVGATFAVDTNLIEVLSGKHALFGGRVQLQGVGHWVERPIDVANSDTVYGVDDASIFFIPSGHSAHAYTLEDTNAVEGSWMRWYCEDSSTFSLFQSDGVTLIAELSSAPTSGQYYWIDLMNKGSGSNRWRVAGGQKEP